MMKLTKATLLIGALAVSACTNPDRFGGTGGGNNPGTIALDNADQLSGINDVTSPEYFSQAIGDRVFFEVDQVTLSAAARSTLDGQAQWLIGNVDYIAIIEGHADEQGTREYNIALGDRRANAVRDYLVSKGVPASRLRTLSYGKERPVATCSDESCYSQNRRAVTVISVASIG